LSIPRNPEFHRYLREIFQAEESRPERRIAEGDDVLLFLRSQRTYKVWRSYKSVDLRKTLLERYNPSVGVEQDEKVRRTARRVGLELPEELKARIESDEDGKKEEKKENKEQS
jgi:ATP synthase assembly factor FMC1, mitochondrial